MKTCEKGLFNPEDEEATSARIFRRYSLSAAVSLGGLGDRDRWTLGKSGNGIYVEEVARWFCDD